MFEPSTAGRWTASYNERIAMAVLLVALLIIILLGAFGFAMHALWWIAIAALLLWLLGFILRIGETIARPRRRRWYYW
jgi:membrane protein YdbS with pleckstrin-like domain